MHLVSALASGFAAAPNGTAQIYVRGSSTRATLYDDFEASSSNSSGADVNLGSYGEAIVYVNQLVDVVVKNSDGTSVAQFVAGSEAPNVEVMSQSFTGVDYVTAASGASEPTTLQAVLDLWKTNSGAIDWKVLIAGSATTLTNAFGSLSGLVYNVKSPAYGAVGDGVTNDQAAITAALAAAVAAGGGIVFFPKGTYLTTTAIEWAHNVSMLGVGVGSIVTINSASNASAFTWSTGTLGTTPVWICGMTIQASQVNTGTMLNATVATNLVIDRCWLGGNSNATGYCVLTTGVSKLRILNSHLAINGGSLSALSLSANTFCAIESSIIATTATAYAGSMLKSIAAGASGGRLIVQSTRFDITSVTSAAGSRYAVESTTESTVTGCEFLWTTQNFTAVFLVTGNSKLVELGNDTHSASPRWTMVSGLMGKESQIELTNYVQLTGSSTAVTIPDGYRYWDYESTGTLPTVTMPTKLFYGQRLTIRIANGSGGNWATLTPVGSQITGTPTRSLLAGETLFMEFYVGTYGGSAAWIAFNVKVGS
jgi:hypothetical protein